MSHPSKMNAAALLANLSHDSGDGGLVRGPGSGTSDTIPSMLSPGEAVLPADTVQALGMDAIKALISLTHTPSDQQNSTNGVPAFADGGLVDDRITRDGNSYFATGAVGPNAAIAGGQIGGEISSQNDAAAQALADRQSVASYGAALASQQIPPIQQNAATIMASPSAGVGGSTPAQSPQSLDWAQRNAMRSAEVKASSIHAQTAAEGRAEATGLRQSFGVPPSPSIVGDPITQPNPTAPRAALSSASGAGQGQGAAFGQRAASTPPSRPAPSSYATLPTQRPQPSPVEGFADGGVVSSENEKPAGVLTRAMEAGGVAVNALAQLPSHVPTAPEASPSGAVAQLSAMPVTSQAPQIASSSGLDPWTLRNERRNAEVSASSRTDPKGAAMGLARLKQLDEMEQGVQREDAAMARTALQDSGATARSALDANAAMARQRSQQAGDMARTLVQERSAQGQALINSEGRIEAAGLRAQLAQRDKPAPAGYRWMNNGNLEAIQGGPADPAVRGSRAPLNDVQAKALQFGSRMKSANATLDELASKGVDQPGLIKRAADAMGMGGAANWTQSDDQQRVEQAQRDFVNAVLRRESGAAISESEFSNAKKQYFPQVGDTPEVIAQKKKNREISLSGILAEVPDSDRRVDQVLGQPQSSTDPHLSELMRRAASNPELAQRLKAAGY